MTHQKDILIVRSYGKESVKHDLQNLTCKEKVLWNYDERILS